MPTIFLSYSSKDKTIIRKIAEDLQSAGIEVWLDEWEIKVGDSISKKIDYGLKKSAFVVVALSKHSVASGWVDREWRSKISEEVKSGSVFILPILIENCEIPPSLIDKKYADFSSNYRVALNELIGAIETHSIKKKAEVNISMVALRHEIEASTVESHYLKGIYLFEKNYHDDAIYHLIRATDQLDVCRERIECNLNISRSASILGYNSLSLETAEKAIDDGRKIEDRYTLEKYIWAFVRQGDAKKNLGEHDDAMADYKFALILSEKESYLSLDHVRSVVFERIGNVLGQKGQWDVALSRFRKDLKIRARLFQNRRDPKIARDYLIANQRTASALANLGKLDESIEKFSEAAKHSRDLTEYDYSNPGWHWDLSNALREQGKVLMNLRRLAEAEYLLQEAQRESLISYNLDRKNKRYSDGFMKCKMSLQMFYRLTK